MGKFAAEYIKIRIYLVCYLIWLLIGVYDKLVKPNSVKKKNEQNRTSSAYEEPYIYISIAP